MKYLVRRRARWLVVVALLSAACASTGPSSSSGSSGSSSPIPDLFTSSDFEFPLSLSLVDGWYVQGDSKSEINLQRGDQDAGIYSIALTTVAGATGSDPRLPLPDDLHAWLSQRPEFAPTQPKDVTVGGRPGILIDAVVMPNPDGAIEMFGTGGSYYLVDRPERWRFIEVKTGVGSGIVVLTTAPPDSYAPWWRALDQLLATLTFR